MTDAPPSQAPDSPASPVASDLAPPPRVRARPVVWASLIFGAAFFVGSFFAEGEVGYFVGLALGAIRRSSNTTLSALVHGGYDFVLLMIETVERS